MMYVSDLKPIEVILSQSVLLFVLALYENYAFLFIGNIILNYFIYCSFEIIEKNTQTRSSS